MSGQRGAERREDAPLPVGPGLFMFPAAVGDQTWLPPPAPASPYRQAGATPRTGIWVALVRWPRSTRTLRKPSGATARHWRDRGEPIGADAAVLALARAQMRASDSEGEAALALSPALVSSLDGLARGVRCSRGRVASKFGKVQGVCLGSVSTRAVGFRSPCALATVRLGAPSSAHPRLPPDVRRGGAPTCPGEWTQHASS